MNTKRMTMLAMYTTISLTIFLIESMLPGLTPVPGIKLGLANIVTLWLFLYASPQDAFLVLMMRILISGVMAGQMMSFAYSLCGGILCFGGMAVLFRFLGKSCLIGISIFGAILHNLGQIAVAVIILQSFYILAYLPALLISGILTGAFTGMCAYFASKRLPKDRLSL